MKTTFSRTFVAYGAILLAALLLVGIIFQIGLKGYLKQRTLEDLKTQSTTISQLACAYYTDHDLTGREFLTNLSVAAKISKADAVICDETGKLVLCSRAPLGCEHQGLSITNPTYLQQVQQQEYVVSAGIVEGLYAEPRYVVSTAIREAATNNTVGLVMVSVPIAESLGVVNKLTDIYLFISALVVLAAVIAMTIYTQRSSNPLKAMAKTAIAFGHGDLKARVKVSDSAPDEIRELSLAFNNMAQSLEKSEYQRKEFVANVSHELKTPMTTIGGYVDGILDGTIPADQQRRYLLLVSNETKRLSRLVRSMLDISRLQDQGGIPEEQKTQFDITECAGQVLISFEQKINAKGLDVQVDMPPHSMDTFAHRDYITQVIYNLLDNAIKFCPEGGALGLCIRSSGNKIYVSISNDGQTIPAQELPLLFDRFHKLDKSRSQNRDGWGLGLYIVKTIICSHAEDISVSSQNGRTEFTFTLPMVN